MKKLLEIKITNIHIFHCVSLFYLLMWILNNPHEFLDLFILDVYYLSVLIDQWIIFLVYIMFVYLPEVGIFIFDVLIKKFNIKNKRIIKIFRISIIILGYIYFILFGFLMLISSSINFGESEYW